MKLLTSVFVLFSSLALAQTNIEKSQKPTTLPPKKKAALIQIDPSTAIRISYVHKPWNTNPTQLNSGSVIMRDRATGKLAQIHLIEDAPDSAVFTGLYSIGWQEGRRLQVDFFVPPQELLESPQGMKEIANMIANNKLRRKPFIFRRSQARGQSIEIFDTVQEARAALRGYQAEQQFQGLQNKKYPSDQQVDTARLAEELREKEAAAKAASERARLEQLELKRLAEMKAKEAAANAREKARRKKQGEQLAKEGLDLYREEKFPEATEKFAKAIELDPDNRSYYFQYGVALYKIDEYNKSLVYLNQAEGSHVNAAEKAFFIGLNHYRLKEYDAAVGAFDRVVAANDPNLSPAAQFYKGVTYFEEKKWDDAQKAFQVVLDTSKDPKLDERAEMYIEQILRIRQFEAEKARKWQISATMGAQYDSNINLISDSSLSQGAATDTEGYRGLLMGSVQYRPVYTETKEWALKLDAIYMYSVDTSFQHSDTLRAADPMVVNVSAPWSHKGLLFGKGYKLDITPGYESISMGVEDKTQKEIISSVFLNFGNLFIVNNKLYSNLNLELRNDTNKMESQTGDNDLSAFRVKLLNSNLHFMNDSKTKIMTTEAALTHNAAAGRNMAYNRFDVALGWLQPFYWDTTATVKLGYYYLNYPEHFDGRNDNNITFTLGGIKKLNSIFSAGIVGSYSDNISSASAYTYKKWTAMLTLSALQAF